MPAGFSDFYTIKYNNNGIEVELNPLENDVSGGGELILSNVAFSGPTEGRGQAVVRDNKLYYTPPAEYTSQNILTYTVTDGTGQSQTAFIFINLTPNNVPVIDTPIADLTLDAGDDVAASASFSDPDDDNLEYSATLESGEVLPDWLIFDAETATFSGTPDNGDAGSISVSVTASDGTATTTDIFSITVNAVEEPEPVADITGTEGRDFICATNESETILGLGGNDIILARNGDDIVNGGTGHDKIYGGRGNDKLDGDTGNDILAGGSGHDELYGGEGNDKLFGGRHSDSLSGGDGNDCLFGGSGHDTLRGGEGADYLVGGRGNDLFVFETFADSFTGEQDTIRDFRQGRDRIDISGLNIEFENLTFSTGDGNTYIDHSESDFSVIADGTLDFNADDFIV